MDAIPLFSTICRAALPAKRPIVGSLEKIDMGCTFSPGLSSSALELRDLRSRNASLFLFERTGVDATETSSSLSLSMTSPRGENGRVSCRQCQPFWKSVPKSTLPQLEKREWQCEIVPVANLVSLHVGLFSLTLAFHGARGFDLLEARKSNLLKHVPSLLGPGGSWNEKLSRSQDFRRQCGQ